MSGIIVISERKEDYQFGSNIAALLQVEVAQVTRRIEFKGIYSRNPSSIVLWDVDHPSTTNDIHSLFLNGVGRILADLVPADRVFAISSEPLNYTPRIFNLPVFGHHIYRNNEGTADFIVSKIMKAKFLNESFGLIKQLVDGVEPKLIQLRDSQHRKQVRQAISNVLEARNLPSQLANIAIQAADELMMNAIFDAPFQSGQYYKRKSDRASHFALQEKECVDVYMVSCKDFLALSVTDQFGTLDKDAVLNCIRKNYEVQSYVPDESSPGGHLGIYGVMASGVSLLFACDPKKRTEVTLFVPLAKTTKAALSKFRFFSFL